MARPDPKIRRSPLTLVGRAEVAVGLVVLTAGYLAATYALQASEWAVMTDELQSSKLASSAAETLSPVPTIHGQGYGALSQLYPLLISPLFGLFSAPDAVTAAHGVNALLLASAAVPAYLLGRDVTGSRGAGYAAAALTAFVPWLVLSATLLTENAAYPAFVWGVWLCYRTVVAPSASRDAAALGGVALAFFGRTQLVVLAVVLPAAILAHEVRFGAAESGGNALLRARRAVVRHPLLACAYAAAGITACAALALGRSPDAILGAYGQTAHENLFPAGTWRSAAVHLDYVVLGVGIAPFLLAGAWSAVALVRPARPESHAFALLFALLVPLLTLEAASFDLRFTPGAFVQDRYLCYLAPLAAVGAAAGSLEPRHRLQTAAFVVAGLAFVWASGLARYGGTVLFWASPAAAFQKSLTGAASALGLSLTSLIRIATVLCTATLAAFLWRGLARPALLLVGVAGAAFGAAEAAYVADREALPITTRPTAIEGVRRDWVDAAAPAGASVGLLPNAQLSPEYWWDAEFWNKSIDRMLDLGGPRPTPFPVDRVRVDQRTGRVRTDVMPDLLVVAAGETRLRLAHTTTVATAAPLALVRVRRPYRALWLTHGASPDGWAFPQKLVRLRFFPSGRPGPRRVLLTLSAFADERRAPTFAVRSGPTTRRGRASVTGAVQVAFGVCVPRAGFASATLLAAGGVRLSDGRVVSLHIDRIQTSALPGRCAAGSPEAGS